MSSLISFSVVYNFDRTGVLLSNNTASVLVRAYQGGRYSYFNTGVYIEPEHWCSKQSKVKNHSRERRFNSNIQSKLRHLEQVEANLAHQKGSCSLAQLKKHANQKSDQNFIEFYRKELKEERNRIATSSHINFKQTLKHLEDFSPQLSFADLNQKTVRAFQHFLFNKGLKHNTVQKHYRFFRKYVRLAVQQQLILANDNPFNHMTMGAKKTEMVFLTEEEFKVFREYQAPADKPMWHHVHQCFLFCCYTGLRYCDLCQLTDNNFHESEDGYFLRIAELKKTKKPYLQNIRLLFNKDRNKVSPPEAIIRELIADSEYRPGKKLCKIAYSNANSYRRILKQIAQSLPLREAVKEKIGTHTSRHSFGTYLASRVSIIVLKDLMGHSDVKETMVYVHLSDKQKETALLNVNW